MGGALAAGRRLLCAGSPARLLVSGAAVVAIVAGGAAAAGWVVERATGRLGIAGFALQALVLSTMLAFRSLVAAAGGVRDALERGDLEMARGSVARHLVSRPTAALGPAHVASAAVESVAENLTDSLVAPVCFYLAFGLPGAFFYRAVNTADAMLGYREGPLEHFGKAAARLDDLLNLLPARLAALAIVAAAALTGEDARNAWRTLRRDARGTASPNAGWTMAAMAGALGVVLEKPATYRLGGGREPAAIDIGRATRVMAVAAMLAIALMSAVWLLLYRYATAIT
jgi:adenosylcobinamide-phosphate synthase